MEYKKVVIFSDGGARNNPGPGAGGAVVYFDENHQVLGVGNYYGKVTNNQAEYRALVDAVNLVIKHYEEDLSVVELEVYLDSELMVKQLNGEYQVRNHELKEFYDDLQLKMSKFGKTDINHVLRANNKLADSLVNAVLDRWGV